MHFRSYGKESKPKSRSDDDTYTTRVDHQYHYDVEEHLNNPKTVTFFLSVSFAHVKFFFFVKSLFTQAFTTYLSTMHGKYICCHFYLYSYVTLFLLYRYIFITKRQTRFNQNSTVYLTQN